MVGYDLSALIAWGHVVPPTSQKLAQTAGGVRGVCGERGGRLRVIDGAPRKLSAGSTSPRRPDQRPRPRTLGAWPDVRAVKSRQARLGQCSGMTPDAVPERQRRSRRKGSIGRWRYRAESQKPTFAHIA